MDAKFNVVRYVIAAIYVVFAMPSSHAGELRHELSFAWDDLTVGYDFLEGERYTRLWDSGLSFSDEPGSPELPVCRFSFLVPPDAIGFEVNSIATECEPERRLRSSLFPVQQPSSTGMEDASVPVSPNRAAYSRYHGQFMAWIEGEQWIENKWRIVNVAVMPTCYDDANLTLTPARHLTVTLRYGSESSSCPTKSDSATSRQSSAFSTSPWGIGAFVVNPGDFSSDYGATTGPIVTGPTVVTTLNHYVIIVPESMAEAARDLAAWKSQKGYKTTLATVESILADSQYAADGSKGREDDAASVRAYLKERYQEYGGRFYCLLIGDYRTSMPIRYLVQCNKESHLHSDHELESDCCAPTDAYFAHLETDWELSRDGRWGRPMLKFEEEWRQSNITIGRLLCSTPEQVHAYLSKLILYETNPGRGKLDYLNRATFFEQSRPKDGVNPKYKLCSLIGDSDTVRKRLALFVDTIAFRDNSHKGAIPYVPTSSGLLKSMSNSGFSSWHGHGTPREVGIRCGYHGWDRMALFANSGDCNIDPDEFLANGAYMPEDAVNTLDAMNNAERPGVVYSISCSNAPFDGRGEENMSLEDNSYNINLASAYTVGGDYGGIAFLGYSRAGYKTTSANMEAKFVDGLIENPKMGLAEDFSKLNSPSADFGRLIKFRHHLIGDPECEMWMGAPAKMDAVMGVLASRVVVAGADVDKSTVSIWDGNEGSAIQYYVNGTSFRMPARENPSLNPIVAYGVWKRGKLPLMHLQMFPGEIGHKKLAFHINSSDFTNLVSYERPCILSAGADISITSSSHIILDGGLEIMSDAKLHLNTDTGISISNLIFSADSEISVESGETTLECNVQIEAGSEFTISNEAQ